MHCCHEHRFAQRTASHWRYFIQRGLAKPFEFQHLPH